jgi:putative selenium metabolism protein SsnA
MIITNSTIITWDTAKGILTGYAVLINDSKIIEIEKQNELLEKYPKEERFDAKGKFLMPGLICAHTHFYGAFSRGINIPGDAAADFPEILKKLWWPLDRSLTIEDVKYSTLVCLIDAIKHGTTTLFDHHASPLAIHGSLDAIENAFYETGVRGVVCYEVSDRYGKSSCVEGIEENLRMIEKTKRSDNNKELVKATFGLHASLTVSEETLTDVRKCLPESIGIHIHVAEHQIDEYDSIKKSGTRVIDRLERYNLLGKNSIVVHGVHLDDKELQILKGLNTWVTHQPRSNMNNAVGMADVESMLRLGIPVCLGNDGFSNSMLDEWRSCYLAHKLWFRDPRKMNGNSVIEMAIRNNSDLATQFFDNQTIGVIKPGAKADLIIVDYLPITQVTNDNLPWQILFGFRESSITDTMVNGKWLMNDRVLVGLNEKSIHEEAHRLSKEVWKRYQQQFVA